MGDENVSVGWDEIPFVENFLSALQVERPVAKLRLVRRAPKLQSVQFHARVLQVRAVRQMVPDVLRVDGVFQLLLLMPQQRHLVEKSLL